MVPSTGAWMLFEEKGEDEDVSDDEDHDICFKQPADDEELEQCYEAMENCPVEAIGDDG